MNHPRLLTRVLVGVTGVVLTSFAWITAADAIRSVAWSEAQRAADAAALAGAGTLLISPMDPAPAREAAMRFAGENPVVGRTPVLAPEDVEVDLEEGIVRVRVGVTVYRVPNAFAWALGAAEVSVTAVAAAEACAPRPGPGGCAVLKFLRLIE